MQGLDKRYKYGNRESEYGWEIDDINPDGGDGLSNLRPLQWEKKLDKVDGKLNCYVAANGINSLGL